MANKRERNSAEVKVLRKAAANGTVSLSPWPLIGAAILYFLFVDDVRLTGEPKVEYDFIVVGGGSAGCILATKLAESGKHTVLLLEAGQRTRDGFFTEQTVPGAAADNLAFGNVDWQYQIESQTTPLAGSLPALYKERRYPIPRGKGLGGSNELNFMLHVRGTSDDYAAWEQATGDARWGPAAMAAAESEYEERISFQSKAADDTHPVSAAFVRAGGESVWGNATSYNAGSVRNGAVHYEHATKHGVRQSTARQWLLPMLRDGAVSNLDVVVGAEVQRLVLEENQRGGLKTGAHVSGVTVNLGPTPGFLGLSAPVLGTLFPAVPALLTKYVIGGRREGSWNIRARNEVILTAGAYESPHILLKSGIGDKDALKKAKIRQHVDLPGVGKHLQDHPLVALKYRFGAAGGAWAPVTVTKAWLGYPSLTAAYFAQGKGMLSSSAADVGYFGASNESWTGRPDLQLYGMLTAGDAGFYTNCLHLSSEFVGDVGEPADYGIFAQGIVAGASLLHPAAEGTVELNQKTPGAGKPKITYELFDNAEDVDRMIEAVRRMQSIMAQPAMEQFEPQLLFSRTLAKEFGEDTDEYWREYIKRTGFPVYHPTGTCRMGKLGDPGVVVDGSLKVLGVTGLRVADASIMPDIVSGNTQVPSAAIGVQAARILNKQYVD